MRVTRRLLNRRRVLAGAASTLATLALGCDKRGDAANDTIGPTIAPAELASRMSDVESGRVAVLYVGPEALFGRGHVPGARRLPPVETKEGERALAAALAALGQDVTAVVYCGCCPYRSCPNVRPASKILRESGRSKALVLDLPTSFKADWIDKGLPVQKS